MDAAFTMGRAAAEVIRLAVFAAAAAFMVAAVDSTAAVLAAVESMAVAALMVAADIASGPSEVWAGVPADVRETPA